LIDWSKLPDLAAVALLTCAFASVARRKHTDVSRIWLIGWLMIALHFAASMLLALPGVWGIVAVVITLSALVWAGELFRWASLPYRMEHGSQWMLGLLVGSLTLYIVVLSTVPTIHWALNAAAALVGFLPIAVTLTTLPKFRHLMRWLTTVLYGALSIFLLIVQHRPTDGSDLALNAVLFSVYFGCCINFIYMYRRATAGAFITIAGFLTWAGVFVAAPSFQAFLPNLHLESEVWNLPKYVVAVGMILLLLEDQIEHNKYLALHDELTGLPNRRLFQDRLDNALERARRTKTQTALLLLDLDRFKQVNDRLGHHAGDLLLQHVSFLLAGRIRRSDTVARTGGDEFCLILEEPTSPEDAEQVADSLMNLIRQPIDLGQHTVSIGASIGIAIFPEDARDAEALCIAADLRMYAHKNEGKAAEARAILGSEHLPGLI
jgi:diguanylate cyclase (GGDEF)-like protein